MDASAFRALLADGPVLADGGMGTTLIARGAAPQTCLEDRNLRDPEAVEVVHRGFVEAGARLVLTNTFGANRFRLERHGMADRVAAICRAAVPLARRAGAEIVAGSMGPLGVRLAPYGRVRVEDAFDAYREQASALVEAGVDLLVVETQSDLRELEQAVAAVREAAPGVAVVTSATFTRDDRTLLGSTPEAVATAMADLHVDALGANCGEGPAQILRVVDLMRQQARGLPLVARPNAGGPAEIGGRFVYPATPEYVAELADTLLDRGVAILGGCCGTGPEHTRAMAATLRARARARPDAPEPAAVVVAPPPLERSPRTAGSTVRPTALASILAGGDLVVAVEMEPPRSFNAAALVAAAGTLHDAGADVIDVADSPMAKMRMSAWAACRLIQEQAGVETTLHFPTRGRNLLRLQGDLLGAHALGIRNLFVCVGDPVTIGDYPQGSGNVDVTATGLLALIEEGFNAGVDQSGSSIGEPTAFFAGAAVAPGARDLRREVRLTRRKVDSGARFLLSQPLYSVEPLRAFYRAYEEEAGKPLPIPILVGVLPLSSARHAAFLHNEVPGITIPERVRAPMEAAGEGGSAWRQGLAIAADLIDRFLGEGVAGIYVMPQFGRYDRAAEVIEVARRAGAGT
jgi:methionine synthase / methylenetetrahydrofolate reductase(NADPH)